jgi:hypothetical protein
MVQKDSMALVRGEIAAAAERQAWPGAAPGRDTRSFGKMLVTAVVSAVLPLP